MDRNRDYFGAAAPASTLALERGRRATKPLVNKTRPMTAPRANQTNRLLFDEIGLRPRIFIASHQS
jgi:hypothetical protein